MLLLFIGSFSIIIYYLLVIEFIGASTSPFVFIEIIGCIGYLPWEASMTFSYIYLFSLCINRKEEAALYKARNQLNDLKIENHIRASKSLSNIKKILCAKIPNSEIVD